jgi:hypothetical protein
MFSQGDSGNAQEYTMRRVFSLFVVIHLSIALGGTVHLTTAVADDPVKQLILSGESFVVDGCPAFILLPPEEKRATPQPWVMYAPTLPGLPDEHEKWMHEQFLAAGVVVCQELIDFVIKAACAGAQPTPFIVRCNDVPDDEVRHVLPWRTIQLDPLYRGAWIVAGDLDGDGQAEIVSARNHDQDDVHYTSSVVIHRLDGSVLWRWGQAEAGRNQLHHDVAAQVYDWDGDGVNEVIVAADQAVIELDGKTGQEKRRFAIPANASDCLVFCNLTGGERPTDLLVKTRYTQIWAFNREGRQLWTSEMPGGQRTAHQPRPIDIDGDGLDEIVAGYALLNADGSVRWTLDDRDPALAQGKRPSVGHLDCARLFSLGQDAAQSTLALTFCGGDRIALVAGDGQVRWNIPGRHFESIDVGKVCRQIPGPQIVVDIPYAPHGEQPIWVLDGQGTLLGQILNDESRFHRLIDWHGQGIESIIVGQPPAMYDGETGCKQAIFEMPLSVGETPADPTKESILCLNADMDGDGVPDILYSTNPATTVYVYRNERGAKPAGPVPLGTGVNWTLY